MAVELSNENVLCEQCGNEYESVGIHWSRSSCNHPSLDKTTKNALIGLLMSDGSVGNKNYTNQYVSVAMVTKPFLEWLDDEFGWLSTGVSLDRTAEKSAKLNRERGFRNDAKKENYKDLYRIITRSHPFITSLTEWYDGGKKVWPNNIELTPTVLLMLYVGDGYYSDKKAARYIQISMINEKENEEKVVDYFTKQGLPKPSRWVKGEPAWTVNDSYELFYHMAQSPLWDGPPPGFEYKFPQNFGGTGKDMSDLGVKPEKIFDHHDQQKWDNR